MEERPANLKWSVLLGMGTPARQAFIRRDIGLGSVNPTSVPVKKDFLALPIAQSGSAVSGKMSTRCLGRQPDALFHLNPLVSRCNSIGYTWLDETT